MASWMDILSLLATISACVALVWGAIFLLGQLDQSLEGAKEKLKDQGLHISDQGVSVKTTRRFDREDYVDATQRGFVKVLESASYGQDTTPAQGLNKSHSKTQSLGKTPLIAPLGDDTDTRGPGEEKKKRFWRRKRD